MPSGGGELVIRDGIVAIFCRFAIESVTDLKKERIAGMLFCIARGF